jgi:outer membrane protein insertion porin family
MRVRVLAVVLVFIAATAFAQPGPERYAGRPVSEIRLFLERQPFTDTAINELIATPIGQPLSLAAVRESIAHIYSLGRFQDIQVEAADGPNGGVTLRYNLIPIHAVERVEFRGPLGLSESLLRDAISDRFGRRPPLSRADEASRTLERLYEDRGYFSASVRLESTELDDPPRTILTFNIDAGPQARVRGIEVAGDPGTSRQDLLNRVGVTAGGPYERPRVNDRLAEYVQRLKKRGHLQAAASHTAQISPDGASADLTLEVRAGPVVDVAFAGDPVPSARRDELVPVDREGSVDEDLLEDSSQRIRDYLRQEGNCKGDVSVEPRETAGRLTIVFTVRKGPLCRVAPEGVEVSGNTSVPIEDLRPLIVLAPGGPYVPSSLDTASGAVERLYRTRGYAWVDVKTAENELSGAAGSGTSTIRPSIIIVEGPRASIGEIALSGVTALSEAELRGLLQLTPGMPYYEPTLRAARDTVELEYLNLGFASAQVTFVPSVSEDKTRVDLTVRVVEGVQTIVDHVIIVGNHKTAEEVIRRELAFKPGTPLGLRDLIESRSRLSSLGLFRRIDIRELEHGPSSRRDVLVTVEEAPATAIGYGGGLEATRFRIAGPDGEAVEDLQLLPRGFFDIGRRNLGGKNRSVNFFTRVSLRPNDSVESPENPGSIGLNEYRVVGTFREPRALRWNADFMLTGAIEQGSRSSFNFNRKGVTAELIRRLTVGLRTNVRYTFSTTRTFDERLSEEEQALIDRRFPQVRLSVVSGAISLDRRDDVVEPTKGMFLSAETSMASRATGGEVGFLKTYMQGYWFKQIPGAPRVILATRASLGLADGFAREVPPVDEDGRPIEGPPIIVEDLPASERFFAGGDTTIRGYALDTVGAPNTISPAGFPRGGNAVLIMNGELRLAIWKDFGAAVFVDGGNVFARVTQFDFGELRGSVGFGLRYRSPIGPVRLDLGFKLDRRELGGTLEDRTGLHFSIGQAF